MEAHSTAAAASDVVVDSGTTDEQNGTTTSHDTPTAISDKTTPSTHPADSTTNIKPSAATEKQKLDYLKSLHARGGFILSCKTLVSLHGVVKRDGGGEDGGGGGEEKREWGIMGGGILSLVSRQHHLSLVFASPESGEITQEFEIQRSIDSTYSSSNTIYSNLSHNFSVFVTMTTEENKGVIHGVNFPDANVASKVCKIINKLTNTGPSSASASDEDNGGQVPTTKRLKVDREGSETGGSVDEVDFPFPVVWRRKKKDDDRINQISNTGYFRHSLLEPGQNQSVPIESGATRSTSFVEFTFHQPSPTAPIPVPPPVPPPSFTPSPSSSSLGDSTLTSGSFASTFSGSSLEVPAPPKRDTSEESLLYEINTFDRRNLHHVTSVEKAAASEGGSNDGGKIGTMFRNGFDLMLPKLQAKYGVEKTASISSWGEVEGFDDFNGIIFE